MKYTSRHILGFLEEWAPESTKLEYDNVGLLVGNHDREIERVLVCLDVTDRVVDEALAGNANLIVAHHPLIFKKLSRITSADPIGSLIFRLVKNDVGLIAAHTNLDAAPGGVSFVLADQLGLLNTKFLKGERPAGMSADSDSEYGFGAWGELPEPVTTADFLSLASDKLNSNGLRYSGSPEYVQKVAVCGGAGSFLIGEAIKRDADAYITADLKYHDFFYGTGSFLLVDAGHYESEVFVIETLCDRLRNRFTKLDVFGTRVNTNPVTFFLNKTVKQIVN